MVCYSTEYIHYVLRIPPQAASTCLLILRVSNKIFATTPIFVSRILHYFVVTSSLLELVNVYPVFVLLLDEDVHQCGRCKELFYSVQSYFDHKKAKNCRKVRHESVSLKSPPLQKKFSEDNRPFGSNAIAHSSPSCETSAVACSLKPLPPSKHHRSAGVIENESTVHAKDVAPSDNEYMAPAMKRQAAREILDHGSSDMVEKTSMETCKVLLTFFGCCCFSSLYALTVYVIIIYMHLYYMAVIDVLKPHHLAKCRIIPHFICKFRYISHVSCC